ncbi:hypothetical protein ACEN8I_20030 [Polaromonas sp. CT11-55]|uniref:hypothetical protein n=1 Tax=Polaromonas sp. CT11-55 TaxID=3243045 RepID=UPI0039A647C8
MPLSGRDYMKQRAIGFQQLRARVIRTYFVPGMAFLLAFIVASVMDAPAWLQFSISGVGFVLLCIGDYKYKCPVCKRTPAEGDGPDFNPKSCGRCGAILLWREDSGAKDNQPV